MQWLGFWLQREHNIMIMFLSQDHAWNQILINLGILVAIKNTLSHINYHFWKVGFKVVIYPVAALPNDRYTSFGMSIAIKIPFWLALRLWRNRFLSKSNQSTYFGIFSPFLSNVLNILTNLRWILWCDHPSSILSIQTFHDGTIIMLRSASLIGAVRKQRHHVLRLMLLRTSAK